MSEHRLCNLLVASASVPPSAVRAPQENPFGILCDPEMPWGTFSTTTATGFGGLTLAELINSGVIYLKSAKLR